MTFVFLPLQLCAFISCHVVFLYTFPSFDLVVNVINWQWSCQIILL